MCTDAAPTLPASWPLFLEFFPVMHVPATVQDDVARQLAEDLGAGDVTGALVDPDRGEGLRNSRTSS